MWLGQTWAQQSQSEPERMIVDIVSSHCHVAARGTLANGISARFQRHTTSLATGGGSANPCWTGHAQRYFQKELKINLKLKSYPCKLIELGAFLRKRYSDLVSEDYRDITVRSTDRDRTLLSAEANLGSFYGVDSNFVPVPIHTVPVVDDHLLRFPITG